MFSPAALWIAFLGCLALIGLAGSRLSAEAGVIARVTGLGGSWIGLALLATVTSLPELVTGASSVLFARAPDIAVGDVLGSCAFNLLLLAALDLLEPRESVYSRATHGHVLSAGFGIALLAAAGASLLPGAREAGAAVGHVGAATLAVLALYLVAMRTLFRYERDQRREFVAAEAAAVEPGALPGAVRRYLLAATVVVGGGAALPFVGRSLAAAMGWSETFVGTLFVALATSVPEIVVTVAALRAGAADMAVSNLLGSNLFNCAILAVDDLLFLPGPILAAASPQHAMTAFAAIGMSSLVIVGVLAQPRRRLVRGLGWVGVALAAVYLLNALLLAAGGG